MSRPGFWDNQEKAQATMAELKSLTALLKPIREVESSLADLGAMLEMAAEDESFALEVPHVLDRLEPIVDDSNT